MAEAKDKKTEDPKEQKYADIQEQVLSCIRAGEDYRDRFSRDWDAIEKQIRMVPPAEWDKKEDWQSKIYVGLQAKTSESAYSNMSAMVFPSESFFNLAATKQRDRDEESALEDLFKVIMSRGGFYFQKDYLLQGAIDQGTGWTKLVVNKDRDGIQYIWRSCYDCLTDPEARNDWTKAKFWIDLYPKDASFIVDELRKGDKSLYEPEQLKAALDSLEGQAATMRNDEIERIRNIDGTGYIQIPKQYRSVLLYEFWGWVSEPKDPKDHSKGMELKLKVVTMLNKDFVIRCEDNEYGFIPAVLGRIKPRKFEIYGKGFLLNGMGTQDLMNSMINLGFDSAKICAMDITVLDAERIADPTTIQYKPLAVWLVKGSPNDAVRMTRQSAMSAMNDILNGIGTLDTIHQDVTGVTRQAEGSQAITPSGEDNTLGEYKMKMAAIDKRFLSVAKMFEEDYVKEVLRKTYMIVVNPKLFKQEAANDMIGFKPIMKTDPASGVSVNLGEMPRILLSELQKKDAMQWNFSASGVMQFSQRQEIMMKLKEALMAAVNNPTLAALTNVDTLWRRIFQVSEIPDWEEIVKSKDDVEKLKEFLSGMMGGVPAQPRPGMPQGAPPMPMPQPPVMNGMPPMPTPVGV